ncbi:MAG TPA: pilus assembly protein, partial [Anaerolineae bacterium]|nr:pilus assembly protein [Anaerolineae bacterium]
MSREKGQTMVEFALILPILLLVMFVIIESGRIFQAYITVQHAAREGARYAVTGRWEEEFVGEPDPRVASIEDVTRNALAGLTLAGPAGYDENGRILTGHYEIKIFGQNPNPPPALLEGYAGLPNEKVAVQVAYRLEIITPILNAIAPSVEVKGYQEMINEDFGQLGGGGFAGLREPPSPIPPEIPTAGASPTPTDTPTGTNTPTPTITGTPTETPTPSSTPVCPVIIEEPVYEVDTTVTVSGDPGDTIVIRDMDAGGVEIGSGVVVGSGYCNGSVVINVNGNLVDGHIIAAISTLHPSSDTACVGVTTCWPTSTPTATATPATPTATATSTPTGPYIVLDRTCTSEGEAANITVYGYNWEPNPGKTIIIQWDGAVKDNFSSRANWSTIINVSASETTSGTHAVRAALLQPPYDEDTEYIDIPCPSTPTPTPT